MVAEMIEDYDWESDEAEDWESDEAFAESEDSAEDIGEARRRRRQGRYYQPNRMSRPGVRGVQGVRVRGQDGRVSKLAFPARVATAAETNRGLAKQALASRTLEARLNRLEGKSKKDGSVSGLVTLAIGGGLAGFGAIRAGKDNTSSGNLLGKWAAQRSSQTAALVAGTQLVTSAAKVVVQGRYDKGAISITSDVFAAALLAAFAFGSFHQPDRNFGADSPEDAEKLKANVNIGDVIVVRNGGPAYRVLQGDSGERLLLQLTPNRVDLAV